MAAGPHVVVAAGPSRNILSDGGDNVKSRSHLVAGALSGRRPQGHLPILPQLAPSREWRCARPSEPQGDPGRPRSLPRRAVPPRWRALAGSLPWFGRAGPAVASRRLGRDQHRSPPRWSPAPGSWSRPRTDSSRPSRAAPEPAGCQRGAAGGEPAGVPRGPPFSWTCAPDSYSTARQVTVRSTPLKRWSRSTTRAPTPFTSSASI